MGLLPTPKVYAPDATQLIAEKAMVWLPQPNEVMKNRLQQALFILSQRSLYARVFYMPPSKRLIERLCAAWFQHQCSSYRLSTIQPDAYTYLSSIALAKAVQPNSLQYQIMVITLPEQIEQVAEQLTQLYPHQIFHYHSYPTTKQIQADLIISTIPIPFPCATIHISPQITYLDQLSLDHAFQHLRCKQQKTELFWWLDQMEVSLHIPEGEFPYVLEEKKKWRLFVCLQAQKKSRIYISPASMVPTLYFHLHIDDLSFLDQPLEQFIHVLKHPSLQADWRTVSADACTQLLSERIAAYYQYLEHMLPAN